MSQAAAWIWLPGGLLWAVIGLAGACRGKTHHALSIAWFACGLMGTEMAVPLAAIAVAGSAVLAALGGLHTWPGRSSTPTTSLPWCMNCCPWSATPSGWGG